jgi:hypothetical protein
VRPAREAFDRGVRSGDEHERGDEDDDEEHRRRIVEDRVRQLREDGFLFVFGADRAAVAADEIEMRVVDVFDSGDRRQIGQPREHESGEQSRQQQGVAGVLAARLLERRNRVGHGLHTGQCDGSGRERAQDDEDGGQAESRLIADVAVHDRVVGGLGVRGVAESDADETDRHREEHGTEEQVGRHGQQHRSGS